MACIDINNFLSNDNKSLAILAYAKKYAEESIKQSIENKIDNLVNGKYKEKIKIIRNKAIAHWDNNKLDNIEDFWSKEFEEIVDTIGDMLKTLGIKTESKFNYGDITSIIKIVEKKVGVSG